MEIMVVLVVALLVLGPTKLPEAGRQVGKAMSEMRRWSRMAQTELREAMGDQPTATPRARQGDASPPAATDTPNFPEEGSFT